MTPVVSVVLCTWNRCDTLPTALDALLRQDQTVPYEVIVVNNASTDGTEEVIAGAEQRAAGLIRHVDEPRQGLSYARNAGIASARGAIIAFTDDDVRVDRNWVRTIASVFEANPDAEWIGGRVVAEWPSPPPAGMDSGRWAPLGLQDHGPDTIIVGAGRPICLIGANLAVRARAFETAGGFSTSVQRVGDGIGSTEDHEFERRLWMRGLTGLYVPDLVVRSAVEPRRLERRYHRDWHRGHGRHLARMRDPEVEAIGGRRIAGVPLHLVRRALWDADARSFARGFIEERLLARSEPPALERDVVSVVIPCFNHARFLPEAIESALRQRAAVQVIVVDDGSSDRSAELAARYPQVQLLRQAHRGLSRARNAGLAAASGAFIVFLDADDRLLPGALDALHRAIGGTPRAAFAYGLFHDIDEEGRALTASRPTRRAAEDFEALLRSNFICVPGAVLYRTAMVRAAGGFRPGIDAASDYDLYLRLAREHPIVGIDSEVIEYRRHASNMSGNSALMLRSTLRAHARHRTASFARAHAEGKRYWREFYGTQLLEQVRRSWRDRHVPAAIAGTFWLALLAPSVLRAAIEGSTRRIGEHGGKSVNS